MSALAMILTAAMMLPGNGPEMESVEMEQALDLSGEWEGTLRTEKGRICPVIFDDGTYNDEGFPAITLDRALIRFEVTEAKDGKLQVEFCATICRGIYRWEGNQLLISIRDTQEKQSTMFPAGTGQILLILHRVKPRK